MQRSRRYVAAAGVSAALLLGTAGPALGAPTVDYANCTEAFAAGAQNIPAGAPGYRPALDRDDDGFACDQGDPANAVGAEDEPATASVADQDENQDENQDQGGQVSLVPVGAAPTGDGSTVALGALVEVPVDSPVAASVLWWTGGGLALMLLGALRSRRTSSRR